MDADATTDFLVSLSLLERNNVVSLHKSMTSVRQASEWGNRGLKGPFARLYFPQDMDRKKRALVLSVICRLHNLRVRVVGLNQTRTVFSAQSE